MAEVKINPESTASVGIVYIIRSNEIVEICNGSSGAVNVLNVPQNLRRIVPQIQNLRIEE